MCIAIPAKVISVDGFVARVERGGETFDVSIAMMSEDVAPGDYVVLMAQRYAIERVTAEQAAAAMALFEEAMAHGARTAAWHGEEDAA